MQPSGAYFHVNVILWRGFAGIWGTLCSGRKVAVITRHRRAVASTHPPAAAAGRKGAARTQSRSCGTWLGLWLWLGLGLGFEFGLGPGGLGLGWGFGLGLGLGSGLGLRAGSGQGQGSGHG